jgi:antirestriction protein ArdC
MATNRERIALTEHERAERRKREQQLTEQAVAQLRNSAGWQRWLTARARVGLRRLSIRNQLLVCLQDPTATYVAGFRAWLKLGYCVRRGTTSHIRVWAPCPPSRKKLQAWRDAGAVAADKPKTHYRLEAVFSQAQVEPLPPPAEPVALDSPVAELEGNTLAWARGPLEKLAGQLGYRVVYRTLARGHGGRCIPKLKVIEISDEPSVNQQISVLCHELAHALVREDRQADDPVLDYPAEELVAESVAHLAVSFVGLDASVAAVPYLASWAEDAAPDTFAHIAELVDRLARRLEDTIAGVEEPCVQCGDSLWEDAEEGGRCINCGTPHPNMTETGA